MIAATEEGLWAAYWADRSIENRNALVRLYMPKVRRLAKILDSNLPSDRVVDLDDFVSVGCIGLMRMVELFDSSRGSKFWTYAFQKVRGEMIRELQRMGTMSERHREQVKRMAEAQETIRERLGYLDDDAVAQELGIPLKQYRRWLAEPERTTESLDATPVGAGGDDEECGYRDTIRDGSAESPSAAMEREDLRAAVLRDFEDREQQIIRMHYYDGLTLREIAEQLGCHEVTVQNWHKAALRALRARFAGSDGVWLEK